MRDSVGTIDHLSQRHRMSRHVSSHQAARKASDPEHSATAVEYGLMVSLIAVAVIVADTLLGTHLSTLSNTVASSA
jgi:pilus assembly protein Flp/PilA